MAKITKSLICALCAILFTANAYADCAPSGVVSAGSDNATLVRAGTGTLSWVVACSTVAAIKYVKFYDKATAPTCGTDVPKIRLMVPASGCTVISAGDRNSEAQYQLGLGYCMVTGAADSSSAAVTAADVVLSFCYR